jgi:uncharacterized protein (TIGR01244 family)
MEPTMKRASRLPLSVTAFALVVAVGCTKPSAEDVSRSGKAAPVEHLPVAAAQEPMRETELGRAAPVHVVGNVYLAGQPSQDDLPALAQRGIRTVVSLRRPEEVDWDEAAAVRAAGMEFISVPFRGADDLTDDMFDRVRQELRERSNEPLVLHCASSNRVGAVWMAHRVLDQDVEIDAALAEAKRAGLRTPELMERAKDYIRREQAEAAAAGPTATR